MSKTSSTTKKAQRAPAVQKVTQSNRFSARQVKLLMVGVVGLLLVIIFFLTGYPQYWAAYVRCGGTPVMIQSGKGIFAASADYYVLPGDKNVYKVRLTNTYYCTEVEASQHARIHPFSEEGILRDKEGN